MYKFSSYNGIVSVTKSVVWNDAYALVSLAEHNLYDYRDGEQ